MNGWPHRACKNVKATIPTPIVDAMITISLGLWEKRSAIIFYGNHLLLQGSQK